MLYQLSYNGPLEKTYPILRFYCIAFQNWWTGKDSNLRTPQGRADLQSAGFNHSPTCPMRKAPNGYRQETSKPEANV